METYDSRKGEKTVDDIFRGHDYKIALSGQGNETPKHSFKMLFVASEFGNTRFVVKILRLYPYLIWMVNNDNISIFHMAVMYRHHDIYNLLYEIGSMRDCIIPFKDKDGNKMLH